MQLARAHQVEARDQQRDAQRNVAQLEGAGRDDLLARLDAVEDGDLIAAIAVSAAASHDATVNPSSVTNLDDYLDARVAPARAQNRDRFFTFATSIAEENALINSGSSAGFGIRLFYDTPARRVFVQEAFESGNGFAAGLDRGTEITAIGTSAANLQTVSSLFTSGGAQAATCSVTARKATPGARGAGTRSGYSAPDGPPGASRRTPGGPSLDLGRDEG